MFLLVVRRRRVDCVREQQGKNDAFHDPNCGFNLPLAEIEASLPSPTLKWSLIEKLPRNTRMYRRARRLSQAQPFSPQSSNTASSNQNALTRRKRIEL
jgi:hypothetical protein